MISRDGHRHQVPENRLSVNRHELFARRGYRQDGDLRWVDDCNEARSVHHAQVRDREGATLQVGGRELVCAGPANEGFRLASNRAYPLDVRIANHRHHQPARHVYGEANVDVFIFYQLVLLERAVDLGELFKGKRTCLHDQIVDCNLHAVLSGARVEGLAHRQRVGHVNLAAHIKVRDGLLRLGQAAGDEHLHPREFDDLRLGKWHSRCWNRLWRSGWHGSGGRSGSPSALLGKIINVIAYDATARAGSLDQAQVDAVFSGYAARQL